MFGIDMRRIAVVQMESKPLEVELNLRKVLSFLGSAAEQQVDLVVFPECVLTGYILDLEEAHSVALPFDSPWIDQIVEACRKFGLLSVIGSLEKDDKGKCFNAAFLIAPDGLLNVYRKTHLPGFGADRYLSAGDQLSDVIGTPVGLLGMLICFDLFFPEAVRILALNGAELIIVPSAWSSVSTYYPDYILRSRSFENGVYIIAADHVGNERGVNFLGRSIVAGIDGQVIAEGSRHSEEMLIVDIEPKRSLEKRRVFTSGIDEIDIFGNRRPDLYGAIVKENPTAGQLVID
jgi:predicted amidohydrolase